MQRRFSRRLRGHSPEKVSMRHAATIATEEAKTKSEKTTTPIVEVACCGDIDRPVPVTCTGTVVATTFDVNTEQSLATRRVCTTTRKSPLFDSSTTSVPSKKRRRASKVSTVSVFFKH